MDGLNCNSKEFYREKLVQNAFYHSGTLSKKTYVQDIQSAYSVPSKVPELFSVCQPYPNNEAVMKLLLL